MQVTTSTELATTIHQSTGVSQSSDTDYSVQYENFVSSICGDTSMNQVTQTE